MINTEQEACRGSNHSQDPHMITFNIILRCRNEGVLQWTLFMG